MPILLASEVMDLSAAALNDVDKTTYDYDTQIPYLKLALKELEEIYLLNSLPVTEKSSSVIEVNSIANRDLMEIKYNVTQGPKLPDTLVEPLQLWERNRGTFPWTPMARKEFIPHDMEGIQTNMFIIWVWQDNKIILLASNQDNDIKIDGIFTLFPKNISENTEIPVYNAQNYLAYKSASLITEFIERDVAKAASLSGKADNSLDNITGITIKSQQAIVARKRPFRSAYKRLGLR